MENSRSRHLELPSKVRNTAYKSALYDIQARLQPLTSRKKCMGVRIRHPYICTKCRRFKLQGFHGSFPPKNFCICEQEFAGNTTCLSPIQLRMPSAPPSNLVATGTSVYSKTGEFSVTETTLVKLAHILSKNNSKQTIVKPTAKDSVEDVIQAIIEKLPGCEKNRFLVYPGNNSKLIKSIMEKKLNWMEGNYSAPNDAQFIWHPTSKNVKFRRLAPYLSPQIVNHFEFHNELSNKANLLDNLTSFCKKNNLEINEMMPVTFGIDLKSKRLNSQILLFVSYFKGLSGEKSPRGKNSEHSVNSLMLPPSHFIGQNIWLIKPAGNNRGRGIQIFNNINEFKRILAELADKYHESKQQHNKEPGNFVVQKYIESPLLISGRKFDIRVWVLVDYKMKCYFYKEGYIRTSSESFTTESESLSDQFVHLTNNAVQKESKAYGKYEKGNQLSFSDAQRYFDSTDPGRISFGKIVERMKEMVCFTLASVKKKLNPKCREFCFEVFGYDFIVDTEGKAWLIECNTNPCIELSSPLLERLIPKMLNEAIFLTVDAIFSDGKSKTQEENDWEFVISLKNACATN
jgi:hypothetical protein